MAKILRQLMLLLVTFSGFERVTALSSTEPLATLPKCALSCLVTAISVSECGLADVACQCTNTQLSANATACIKLGCSVEDSLIAKNATQTQCGAPIRDNRAETDATSIILTTLAVVVVFVRIGYKQFFNSGDIGMDDWIILYTAMASIVSASLNVKLLSGNGMGTDVWTLTPATITAFAKGFYINAILYFADVAILKLSMLFFYLRIFPGRTIQRILWGTIFFNIIFGITFVFTAIFQCTPISYNWQYWRQEGGGTCINISSMAWANASISIALDIWMLAVPISQLKNLKMHWKKKFGVAAMFFVGTFITVVSIVRLSTLVKLRDSDNVTWDYTSVSRWSSIEITVGVICACMPSLRVVLVRLFPILLGTTQRRTEQYYHSGTNGKNGKIGGDSSVSRGHDTPKSRTSWRVNVITDWQVSTSFPKGGEFSRMSSPVNDESGSDSGELVVMETFQKPASVQETYGETEVYGGNRRGSEPVNDEEKTPASPL